MTQKLDEKGRRKRQTKNERFFLGKERYGFMNSYMVKVAIFVPIILVNCALLIQPVLHTVII